MYTFVKVEEVPTTRPGITASQYAAGTSKAYTVRSDATGEEVFEIKPEDEDTIRFVVRLRAARKKPETVGRVTLC